MALLRSIAKMDDRCLRALYFNEFKQGHSTRKAADNINHALGPGTTSHVTVSHWFKRFASGDISFEDKEHTGRPSTFNDDVLLEKLQLHPDATTRELAEEIGCSHVTIENRLHALNYRKVLSRWIPHVLSDVTREVRVSICQSLLLHPKLKEFLTNLVTGDESYVLHENDTRRGFWLPRGEEPPVQPKRNPHCQKVLLCCFFDSHGMLWWDMLQKNDTITGDVYAFQLRQLVATIREKRRRRSEVHLLHDNARPHVASVTRHQLKELGWDTVPHPPYSPDLAPSDYHLFRSLKQYLRGKKFKSYSDLKTDIENFFLSQPPHFWANAIESLPQRWTQVIDTKGDYIVD